MTGDYGNLAVVGLPFMLQYTTLLFDETINASDEIFRTVFDLACVCFYHPLRHYRPINIFGADSRRPSRILSVCYV